MSEFDRAKAHRQSKNLSHLKDEIDEKNAEHIERARQNQHETRHADPEPDAAQRPQGSQPD